MLLKIMGEDNTGDIDSRKTFQLFDHVEAVNFKRDGDAASVEVLFEDRIGSGVEPECFAVPGNAYLMNDQGKTVAHFGSHPVV